VDLGSGTLTSIRDVVARVVELVAPGSKPIFDALPETPRTSLDDGLLKTVEWYRHRYVPAGGA
jgi:hypothetical protein